MNLVRIFQWLLLISLSMATTLVNAAAVMQDDALNSAAVLLKSASFKDKSKAVDLLSAHAGEQAGMVLEAFLDNRLYTAKTDKRLVIADSRGDAYAVTDALTNEDLGRTSKSGLKIITLNNSLRRQIREALALLDLRHPDANRRLAAVNQLLDRPAAEHAQLLQPLLQQEQDDRVREAMQIVTALGALTSDDVQQHLSAIETLEGNVHPAVRNGLAKLQRTAQDPAVMKKIGQVLESIQSKLQVYRFIENMFFGLSLGSVLVLAAIGLAITFGVMGVINMAHGELIMLGAYTTYVIQLLLPDNIGASVLIAIPAAFVVSGLVGIAIERGVIRFLYGRSLETLLATFGISLILQQAVRSIFSPLNRSVATPAWMSGSWEINSALSLTLNRLYIILFALLVFAALYIVLKKTSLGLQVRAVSQNRAMARAMGVRSEWVDAMTFGLGSGIAGVAGVALSQLTNVGPNLGQSYIIDSFMVVVFGGVGNLWGTLVSGMTLGVANKFMEPWSGAVLAKILVLVFIILFIQKRPRGLFPQKGRAAEG